MSRLRLMVRVYRNHDPDLIALCGRDDFELEREMRKALLAYVRGKPYSVKAPPPTGQEVPFKSREVRVDLYYGRDADAIRFIRSVREGFRCAAIKVIFRDALESPYIAPLMEEGPPLGEREEERAGRPGKKEEKKEAPAKAKNKARAGEEAGPAGPGAGKDPERAPEVPGREPPGPGSGSGPQAPENPAGEAESRADRQDAGRAGREHTYKTQDTWLETGGEDDTWDWSAYDSTEG